LQLYPRLKKILRRAKYITLEFPCLQEADSISNVVSAHFYWVTREQGSFDWFKGVINEVDDLDQRVKTNVNSLASRVLINLFLLKFP
jgi:hypothetical protein